MHGPNVKIIRDFIALLEEDELYAWFLQDGATAHMAEKPIDVSQIFRRKDYILRQMAGKKPDFLLWMYVKE